MGRGRPWDRPRARPSEAAPSRFNGANQYVTMGTAPALGTRTVHPGGMDQADRPRCDSLDRDAVGSHGPVRHTAVPLISKGRGEGDGSNVDMNYFLGLDPSGRRLVADFEDNDTVEHTDDNNHPVFNTTGTVIPHNTWTSRCRHVRRDVMAPLRQWESRHRRIRRRGRHRASIRSSISASARPSLHPRQPARGSAGFFQGSMDEVRVWKPRGRKRRSKHPWIGKWS